MCVNVFDCAKDVMSKQMGKQYDFIFRNNLGKQTKDTDREYKRKRNSADSCDSKLKH